MKTTFFLILISFSFILHGQLKAIAGKDRHFCISPKRGIYIAPESKNLGLNDTLGDNPSAQGGIKPYTYKWTTLDGAYDAPEREIDANEYLSSVLVSNPKLIKLPFKTKPFFLTVTDSIGNKSRDTMIVSNTYFSRLNYEFKKKTNDTLEINQWYLHIDPYNTKFFWGKTDFSSDTIGYLNKVWNTKNDSIESWAIDNYGCTSDTDIVKILIEDDVSIHLSNIEELFSNTQNPINDNTIYEFKDKSKSYDVKIINIIGAEVYNKVVSGYLNIGKILPLKATYILMVSENNETKIKLKIEKR